MMRITLAQQLSETWKRLLFLILFFLILGSLLLVLVFQKRYTRFMERDRVQHWNLLKSWQEELVNGSLEKYVQGDNRLFQREKLSEKISEWFRRNPQLLRIVVLQKDGTIILGKENRNVTKHISEMSSSASQREMATLRKIMPKSDFFQQVDIIQIPYRLNRGTEGFLRAELLTGVSETHYAQIARATYHVLLISIGMMIIFGILEAFHRFAQHLSMKQEQLENYAVSLEKSNQHLRLTQKELYISEKLASLGYLAAGIAHEIGNPLGAVLGYVELLQKNVFERAKTEDILHRIERDVERIRQIIQELVTFSRPKALHIQKVDVNLALRNMLSRLPPRQEKEMSLQLDLTDFPLFVDIDEQKFKNVCLNILNNAEDAANSQGEIRISTSRRIRESSTMIGGSEVIAIQFSDTGEGIPEEHLARIFDPFFTTKEPGAGMGLGLSLCHRFIESFHGEIEVRSVVGEGTDVFIFLPPSRSITT